MEQTELNESAREYIIDKLKNMGYSISKLDDSPFTIYAEFNSYSFIADVKHRSRAWRYFEISSKLVEDYNNYSTTAIDKILIFHTLTKRNPDFFIHTDDIQRLGYLVGPDYSIEIQYVNTLPVLRKILEANME